MTTMIWKKLFFFVKFLLLLCSVVSVVGSLMFCLIATSKRTAPRTYDASVWFL